MGNTIWFNSLSVIEQMFFLFISVTNSFNVDTSNPTMFRGPVGSYFGYTVALLANDHGNWVLVGAPKANDSSLTSVDRSITEPGMLLKCPLTGSIYCGDNDKVDIYKGHVQQRCKMNGEDVFYVNNINRSWLGVSLDTIAHSVVVCAHRWKDQYFNAMNGLCFEIPSDLSSSSSTCLPALFNSSMRLTVSNNDSYYNYGMGAMGISATYSQNDLLLGAPGMMDYTGGVVKIFTKNSEPHSVVIQRPRNVMRSGDFVGYSVSTGRYFTDREMYYATGGPRVENVGEVYIFSSMSTSLQNTDVKFVLKGDQLGGYFGGVLCTADVNHDGIDDLLVGAPLQSIEQDEGAVFVYLGPLMENYTMVLQGSNKPNGRFGSAIANLGDLNDDLYDDIVVGAPFEEEGAIYIYNGYRDGIWHEFPQKIMGQSIASSLRGFGSSFSRPLDMDNNKYPDFAVGAYDSDMAVLLYTRSLLTVDVTMTLNPEYVDPREQMTLNLCFRYVGGLNLPDVINLNFSVEVDTMRTDNGDPRRAFIMLERKSVSSITKAFVFLKNIEECYDYEIIFYLIPEKMVDDLFYIPDLVMPIIFEARYKISVDDSCRVCSMLKTFDGNNPNDPWEAVIRKTANFQKDCGDDNVCDSVLRLSSSIYYNDSRDYLTITTKTLFKFRISVENNGEAAYATQVVLHCSSLLTLHHASNEVICYKSQNSSVICNIGNPLKSNDHKEFDIFLEASDFIENEHFDIFLEVVTTSTDRSPTESKQMQISVKLKLDNKFSFTSKAIPNLLVTSNKKEPVAANQSQWMSFGHMFYFQNLGESPMPESFLSLSLCHMEKNDEDLLYMDGYKIWRDLKDAVVPHSYISGYSDGVVTECAGENCRMLSFNISALMPGHTLSVNATYKARVDILDILQQNTEKLDATTVCEVTIPDLPHLLRKKLSYNQQVTTEISPPNLPSKPVKIWVIIISILGGITILVLVTVLLYKLRFFERTKRKKLLKRMKERVGLLQNDPTSEHQAVVIAQDQSLQLDSKMIPK